MIAVGAFILTVTLPFCAFSLGLASVMRIATMAWFAMTAALLLGKRQRPVLLKFAVLAEAIAQTILITAIGASLSYVAATLNFSFQDKILLRLDEFFGPDHRVVFDYVEAHAMLRNLLCIGYGMIGWPVFAIPVILSLAGRTLRLQQYTLAFGLSLIATIGLSIFVPALGAYEQLGLKLTDFPNIFAANATYQTAHIDGLLFARKHVIATLEVFDLKGIIMFPSFHATLAGLFFWTLGPVRFFGPLSLVCNTLVVISSPIYGGHYYVDIIAGLAIAVASIATAKRLLAEPPSVQEELAPVLPISAAAARTPEQIAAG